MSHNIYYGKFTQFHRCCVRQPETGFPQAKRFLGISRCKGASGALTCFVHGCWARRQTDTVPAMPRLRLRHPALPNSLAGWVLVNEAHVPRFWATVWSVVILTGVADGTRAAHLAAVERLYRAVAEQTGSDQLDRIIADGDFDAIESCLGAFLTRLANEAVQRRMELATTWRSALKFINDIFQHLGRRSEPSLAELNSRLLRSERLFSQITPAAPASPKPVRALPAAVIEDLYELFNPSSRRNPFRTEPLRWRNFLVFLFLLHRPGGSGARSGAGRGRAASSRCSRLASAPSPSLFHRLYKHIDRLGETIDRRFGATPSSTSCPTIWPRIPRPARRSLELRKDAEIAELTRQRDLLVASYEAMILVVGELSGMKAWSKFFEGYGGQPRLQTIGNPGNVG